MTKLATFRDELRRQHEGDGAGRRSLPLLAVAAVLVTMIVVAAAHMQILPTYSADDVASILFGAG